jgi:hypothetical protein
VAQWRGDAYADLADLRATTAERTHLAELRAARFEDRLAALLAVGDARAAVGELELAYGLSRTENGGGNC